MQSLQLMTLLLTTVIVLKLAMGYALAADIGPLTIMMNGQPLTKYVLSDHDSIKFNCCVQTNRTSTASIIKYCKQRGALGLIIASKFSTGHITSCGIHCACRKT